MTGSPVDKVQIGECTLWRGDCLDILPYLQDVGAMLFMDPPYGIDYASNWATDDLWSGREIAGDKDTYVRDCVLDLLRGYPALVFGSRKISEPASTRMILTWDKGAALGMGATDLPWKPSSEEIYVIGKGFTGRRDESNVLYHPPVQSMAKNGRLHPNEKPVGLLAKLLRKCPPGGVCDPFMGSGSMAEACAKAGRPFVGIEHNPTYFRRAVERIKALHSQHDLFMGAAA